MSIVCGVWSILSHEEEGKLEDFLITMAERGHGLSVTLLKMKVSGITMARDTPFCDGILSGGWMKGWK